MPDAARSAADLFCPGLAAWRRAGGLRQFPSLDRPMPTCQLKLGSDMRSHALGSAMGQSAPPSFRAAGKNVLRYLTRGASLPARVRLSQLSTLGRITAATGAPQDPAVRAADRGESYGPGAGSRAAKNTASRQGEFAAIDPTLERLLGGSRSPCATSWRPVCRMAQRT